MTETNSLLVMAEQVDGFKGSEVELNPEFWKLQKKRLVKVRKRPGKSGSWSVDLSVPLKIFRDDREAVNGAEIFLLPEELALFTRTLIKHPVLLPINYSQQLAMERGMYRLRLQSQEPFEDFTARLAAALRKLG
ncbi:hypothetical protein [Planococcus salinarum]|uniref:hypothetical protein n=1 Tax=Planococcus salinarum TaxID=622695 RepID=UPI000E3EAB03|nr:hypothetical protein [Planococcus salinarum]TAA72809.1 hypothetical protein D2909_04250 [Planococcus salinarum]